MLTGFSVVSISEERKNRVPLQNSLMGIQSHTMDVAVILFVCLLIDLRLSVPVNSNGHAGTLPPLYGTFTKLRMS